MIFNFKKWFLLLTLILINISNIYGSASPGEMSLDKTKIIRNSHCLLKIEYSPQDNIMSGGLVTIQIPADFIEPQITNSSTPGYIRIDEGASTVGPASISGSGPWTISVSVTTMNEWNSIYITYTNIIAPSQNGLYLFECKSKQAVGNLDYVSSGGFTYIKVIDIDGTGSVDVFPNAGVTNKQVTFSIEYKAEHDITNGALTIDIPGDFTEPQTNSPAVDGFTILNYSGSGSISEFSISGSGPYRIIVTIETMKAGEKFNVIYGNSQGGTYAYFPSIPQTYEFTTMMKGSGGNLKKLNLNADNMNVNVYNSLDGRGNIYFNPENPSVLIDSYNFFGTYFNSYIDIIDGEITFEIPAGFSAPQTNTPAGAGYFNVIGGNISRPAISGSGPWIVNITINTLYRTDTINILYGSGGLGSKVPAVEGTYYLTTKFRGKDGALEPVIDQEGREIKNKIEVLSAFNIDKDGSGRVTINPDEILTNSYNEIEIEYVFDYDISFGMIQFEIPDGFSAPQTSNPAGEGYVRLEYTAGTFGSLSIIGTGPWRIYVPVTAASENFGFELIYGDNSGGGPGAKAPPNSGSYEFTCRFRGTPIGNFKDIEYQKSIEVKTDLKNRGIDGSGYSYVYPQIVGTSSSNLSIAISYQQLEGIFSNGLVVFEVPAGWPPPSTNSSDDGYIKILEIENCILDNIYITGSGPWNINVPVIYSAQGWWDFKIIYGDRSGTGNGITAPAIAGEYNFKPSSMASPSGTLVELAPWEEPEYFYVFNGYNLMYVKELDGSGMANDSILDDLWGDSHPPSTSNQTIRIYYKNDPNLNLSGGMITFDIPANWTMPSTNLGDPGYVKILSEINCHTGNLSVSGTGPWTVHVPIINTGSSGDKYSFVLSYGDRSGGGTGITTPPSGNYIFTTKSKWSGGTLAPLGKFFQPCISVSDGSGSGTGTITCDKSTAMPGEYETYNFTYTANSDNIWLIHLIIPLNWSIPSLDPLSEGYVSVASSTGITSVTINEYSYDGKYSLGENLDNYRILWIYNPSIKTGDTITIKYGDTLSGGPGAQTFLSSGSSEFLFYEYALGDTNIGAWFTNTSPVISISEPTNSQPAVNVQNTKVYPNPFKPNDGKWQTGDESSGICFINLPSKAIIKIYSVSGSLVAELNKNNAANGNYLWNTRNGTDGSGRLLASGIYFAVIQGNGKDDTKVIKIAIIR